METLPLDDAPTFEMLARGDALGVFQFESSGMREALRQVRPTEFDDLIALVALYRPGPMQNIPMYARRKNGHEPVTYTDNRLEPILAGTQGVYIYQEQAMQIAKDLAGFSPAQADDLRKAIGKKNAELMATLKDEFLEGCVGNGVERKVAEHLWAENERSADYSFNKAHAACYALIAYRTAYLKANHPAEYMAALISSVMDTKDRVPFYVQECTEMGIDVLPPDVNASDRDFAVRDGKIRFGLSAVKNVGDNAVRAIVPGARGGRPVPLGVGLLRARRLAARHRARAGEPDPCRRARLHGRPAQGHDGGARPGRRARAQDAGRPQRRPGQPVREPHGRRRRGRAAHAPAGAGRRVGAARAAVVRARDARPVPLEPSAGGRAGEAAPAHRLRALGAGRPQRRRDGDHRGADRLGPAADDQEGRPDGLRAARGPDGRLRGRGLLERLPAGARARSTSTGSWS